MFWGDMAPDEADSSFQSHNMIKISCATSIKPNGCSYRLGCQLRCLRFQCIHPKKTITHSMTIFEACTSSFELQTHLTTGAGKAAGGSRGIRHGGPPRAAPSAVRRPGRTRPPGGARPARSGSRCPPGGEARCGGQLPGGCCGSLLRVAAAAGAGEALPLAYYSPLFCTNMSANSLG